MLGLGEFYRMALPGRQLEGSLAAVAGGALPLLFLLGQVGVMGGLTLLVLVFALVFLFRIGDMPRVSTEVSILSFGFLYVPLLLGHLVLLRGQPLGIQWLFLLMIIVMAGDSTAYYVGSAFGKHRLYPEVSPKKSIEGSLGGLAGSLAGTVIAKMTFFPQLGFGDCVATALLLGVLGQLGDLFESLIKRSCGVKDSGGIVPGHGGILDRLDSVLFAAPVAFYYARFFWK